MRTEGGTSSATSVRGLGELRATSTGLLRTAARTGAPATACFGCGVCSTTVMGGGVASSVFSGGGGNGAAFAGVAAGSGVWAETTTSGRGVDGRIAT